MQYQFRVQSPENLTKFNRTEKEILTCLLQGKLHLEFEFNSVKKKKNQYAIEYHRIQRDQRFNDLSLPK